MDFYKLLKDTRQALENFNFGANEKRIQEFINLGEELYKSYTSLTDDEKIKYKEILDFRRNYIDFCVLIQKIVNKGGKINEKSQEYLVVLSNDMIKLILGMLVTE
jgi:hypothetical protein